MDVLEHEQHGGALAQLAQQRESGLEQAALGARIAARGRGAVAVAQRRHQRGELGAGGAGKRGERGMAVAGQRPQRGEQRGVGELALAEVDALAGQRVAAALGGARDELRHQPGLAHPGFAGHEGERRRARFDLRERRLELGQLARATDEPGARHAGRHARQYGGRPPPPGASATS